MTDDSLKQQARRPFKTCYNCYEVVIEGDMNLKKFPPISCQDCINYKEVVTLEVARNLLKAEIHKVKLKCLENQGKAVMARVEEINRLEEEIQKLKDAWMESEGSYQALNAEWQDEADSVRLAYNKKLAEWKKEKKGLEAQLESLKLAINAFPKPEQFLCGIRVYSALEVDSWLERLRKESEGKAQLKTELGDKIEKIVKSISKFRVGTREVYDGAEKEWEDLKKESDQQ